MSIFLHNSNMTTLKKIQLMTSWFDSEEENRDFDFQTVCMCSMFSRIARRERLYISGGYGLNIEYGPSKRDGFIYGPTPFYTLESKMDVRGFFGLDDLGKNKMAVSLMFGGLKLLCNYSGDEFDKFMPVFSEIYSSEYKNRYLWKGGGDKRSGVSYRVFVHHRVHSIDIEVEASFKELKSNVFTLACRIDPNEYLLKEILGGVGIESGGALVIYPRPSSLLSAIRVPLNFA